MQQTFSFFPLLDEQLYEQTINDIKFEFSFFKDGVKEAVPYETNGKSNISFGKDCEWNTYDDDLTIEVIINLKNGNLIYGENGIAPLNSKVNVYFEIISQKSRSRTMLISNSFVQNDNKEQTIKITAKLPKNTYENSVDINVGLYLCEKSDSLKQGEEKLNNEEGTLLGLLDSKTIFMTGNGSLFPIYIRGSGKSSPLWSLETDYDNPYSDRFQDSIKIYLNSDHPDFEYIDEKNKEKYCDSLVCEIVSDAITQILLNLKQEGYSYTENRESIEEGSIMDYVSHCYNDLNFSNDDPISLSTSVRKFIGGD